MSNTDVPCVPQQLTLGLRKLPDHKQKCFWAEVLRGLSSEERETVRGLLDSWSTVDFVARLHYDILSVLMTYLNMKDAMIMRQVSRTWLRAVDGCDAFWRARCLRHLGIVPRSGSSAPHYRDQVLSHAHTLHHLTQPGNLHEDILPVAVSAMKYRDGILGIACLDSSVQFWNVAAQTLTETIVWKQSLNGIRYFLTCLDFAENYVLVGTQQASVWVVQRTKREDRRQELWGHRAYVSNICVNVALMTLVSCDSYSAIVWSLQDWRQIGQLEFSVVDDTPLLRHVTTLGHIRPQIWVESGSDGMCVYAYQYHLVQWLHIDSSGRTAHRTGICFHSGALGGCCHMATVNNRLRLTYLNKLPAGRMFVQVFELSHDSHRNKQELKKIQEYPIQSVRGDLGAILGQGQQYTLILMDISLILVNATRQVCVGTISLPKGSYVDALESCDCTWLNDLTCSQSSHTILATISNFNKCALIKLTKDFSDCNECLR